MVSQIQCASGVETLELGVSYSFTHKRKGVFVAKLVAVEPTDGDPEPCLLRVQIDTQEGSPYAWMANVRTYVQGRKTTPVMTEKLLRPNLITAVSKV